MPGVQGSKSPKDKANLKRYIPQCLLCDENKEVGKELADKIGKAWDARNLDPVLELLREYAEAWKEGTRVQTYLSKKCLEWATKIEECNSTARVETHLQKQDVHLQQAQGENFQVLGFLNAAVKAAGRQGAHLNAAKAENADMQVEMEMEDEKEVAEDLRILLDAAP